MQVLRANSLIYIYIYYQVYIIVYIVYMYITREQVGQRRVIVSMMENPLRYSVLTQLAVGCTFFVLMTLSYGCAVPAGVFVPTIAAGACFGSLFGVGMEKLFREYLCSAEYV